MTNVAFLGLGAMGAPMAANLLKKGFPLTVWNRSAGRDETLVAAGARRAATPREAAAGADVVATMLADPAAVDATAGGADGLLAGLRPGATWLDFSTVGPADSRRWAARAAERGASFADVPVAGSIAPARDGTLKIFWGGDAATLSRVRPVLAAVSTDVLEMGPVGQGSAMKLVNNSLVGIALAGFAEALRGARLLGLDPARAAEWLLGAPFLAPYAKTKWEFLKAGGAPPTFPVALMAKDLRLMHEATGDAPLARASEDAFRRAEAAGHSQHDISWVLAHGYGGRPN